MTKRKKIGPPTKYRPEYCEQMIEWFRGNSPEDIRIDTIISEADGSERVTRKAKGSHFPTFERFSAIHLGVTGSTLQLWREAQPEFNEAYELCLAIQQDIWKVNCLNGSYNAAFGIFLGKNVYGYRDKTEVEQNHTITQMPVVRIGTKPLELDIGDEPDQSPAQIESNDD